MQSDLIPFRVCLTHTITGSRSILNIRSNDEKCLAWCVAAYRTRVREAATAAAAGRPYKSPANSFQMKHYAEEFEKLNLTGVRFPASEKDVSYCQNGVGEGVFCVIN